MLGELSLVIERLKKAELWEKSAEQSDRDKFGAVIYELTDYGEAITQTMIEEGWMACERTSTGPMKKTSN